jgi:ribonucleotide reductase alpha subunit
VYEYAWSLGLKTTYYLRTLGASRIEKSTIALGKYSDTTKSEVVAAQGSGMEFIPSTVMVEETVRVAVVREELPAPKEAPMEHFIINTAKRPKVEVIGESCESCSA